MTQAPSGNFRCEICNIAVTDQGGLDMHLAGKKHIKKAVQEKEIKKANNKIIKPKNVNLNPKSVNLKPSIDAFKKADKENQKPESKGVFNIHVHKKNQEDRKKFLAAKQQKANLK